MAPATTYMKFSHFTNSLTAEMQIRVQDESAGGRNFFKEFRASTSNVEKVNFLYKRLVKYGLLLDVFRKDRKSDDMALACQKKAKLPIVMSKYLQALPLCISSVLKAETPSVLGEAYAQRAELLFKMGMFEEAAEDIDRAFENKIFDSARTSTLKFYRTKSRFNSRSQPSPRYYQEVPRIPQDQQNPLVPCATKSVEIRLDENKKQGVYAVKDIEIGEVVAVEKPIAFWVVQGDLCHCHNCFELCYNPIPCLSCTKIAFCSEICRNEASSYHQYECPLLFTFNSVCKGTKLNHLALRLTLLLEQESKPHLCKEIQRLAENLETSNDDDKVFHYYLTAAVIFYYVKKHTKKFVSSSREDEDKFKNALFTYLRLCWVYSSRITELFPRSDTLKGQPRFDWGKAGCALYPFLSTMRHSCAPNLFAHHHGTTLVLRAARTIKKGEECFNTHETSYLDFGKKERQRAISRLFHFTCKCKACENNWVQETGDSYLEKNELELRWAMKLMDGDVKEAERYVDVFLRRMKEFERLEPNCNLQLVTELAAYAFGLLGNRRRMNFCISE